MLTKLSSISRHVKCNPSRICWCFIFLIGLAGHVWWRFYLLGWSTRLVLYGWYLPIAKGCGQGIKYTAAIVLFPISRNLVTMLRSTWLRHVIPFDDCMTFHRLCGVIIFLLAWAHALCHIMDGIVMSFQPDELWRQAFPEGNPFMRHGTRDYKSYWCGYTAVTGYSLLILMTIACLFAMKYPRTALKDCWAGKVLNNYSFFWLSHHLLVLPFYTLLICHPLPALYTTEGEWGVSDTYLWVVVPLALYLGERLLRMIRHHAWDTQPRTITLLPDRVMEVRMKKPKGFHCVSGMYIFICCPTISNLEWHPFSLTSAPEDDFIGVHIKMSGDWTRDLYNHFRQLQSCSPKDELKLEGHGGSALMNSCGDSSHGPSWVEVLDYSTPPSQSDLEEWEDKEEEAYFYGSREAALKASVRVVPPLGSSWKSRASDCITSGSKKVEVAGTSTRCVAPVVQIDGPYGAPAQRYSDYPVVVLIGAGIGITPMASVCRSLLHRCRMDLCEHCQKPTRSSKMQKVFFIWTVREGCSMRWFQRVLQQLVCEDYHHLFEVHIYITGPMRPRLHALIRHNNMYSCEEDATPQNLFIAHERPDWHSLLLSIHQQHPQIKKGVFYCGNPGLGSIVRRSIADLVRSEGADFSWHKEVF